MKDKPVNEKKVMVTMDDAVRSQTTVASLAKLKPAFKMNGSSTAGDSSQVTNGASGAVRVGEGECCYKFSVAAAQSGGRTDCREADGARANGGERGARATGEGGGRNGAENDGGAHGDH